MLNLIQHRLVSSLVHRYSELGFRLRLAIYLSLKVFFYFYSKLDSNLKERKSQFAEQGRREINGVICIEGWQNQLSLAILRAYQILFSF